MTTSVTAKSLTAKIRDTSLALGFAAIVSIISTSSSFAFSEATKQACYSDAFRLCSSEIPNVQKTTACMMQRKSQLSAGCRAAVERISAAALQTRSLTPRTTNKSTRRIFGVVSSKLPA